MPEIKTFLDEVRAKELLRPKRIEDADAAEEGDDYKKKKKIVK